MFNKNRKFLVVSIIFVVLSLALNAFIIYQSCLGSGESTSWSDKISESVADVINTVVPNTITEQNMPDFSSFIRKAIGHFGLFGLDAIITSLAVYFSICFSDFYKDYIAVAITSGIGIFVAILTETIQHFIKGRSGEVSDALIDSAGYLIGVLVVFFILFLIYRHKKKASKVVEAN